MAAWYCAPDTTALLVLVASVDLMDLVALIALAALMALTVLLSYTKTGSWFTRSLFLVSYQRVRKAWLLAVLPSKSDAETTQGQSCSSND